MATHHVMVDQVERRQVIRQQVEKLALKQGGTASIDEELLEEVLYLVEYPTALCGSFDEKYLSLPPEAVITPMREHQRYFPVFGQDGKLLPVFITVRNGGAEYLDIVRHGNERVLKARLADARFFFEEDKKVALAQRVDKLKAIVYQEGLGSLWDKTTRLEKLVGHLAKLVGLAEGQLADLERSAHLAKADLVTGMVGEFAELQGVMGREYALLDGEPAMVADAIFEHYLPRFAGDKLPESQAGALLSLADKMDNLVATFSRGLIPSGSQDPFALRRQAAGMVAILIRKKLHISLARFASYAMELLGVTDQDKQAALIAELQEFFRLRLKNILTEEGLRYDMIDAVLGLGCDDVYDMWLRAQALSQESGSSRMETAVRAFTRVGNLAKNTVGEHIDPSLLEAGAEQALFQAYSAAEKQMNQLMAEGKYREALQVVAGLAQPIDGFFGQVMVMVEDLPVRNNRLALLKAITRLAGQIADLGKLATN
jgi:glycyl-tRNA synthetase beta chain